jgi:hypothetical protein
MIQVIKNEIKQNALHRRERRNVRTQGQETIISLEDDSLIPIEFHPAVMNPGVKGAGATPRVVSASPTRMEILNPTINLQSPTKSSGPASLTLDREAELGFIMIYLDYVFPYLFPFYRPSLMETGRHWLLSLLCQNEVSFCTAASLSSYFFSIALQDGQRAMQNICRALVKTQLMENMDLAVEKIQQDIVVLSDVRVSLIESTRILGEIIQLFIMEVMVRTEVDWTIHLTPALSLFDDIFKTYGTCSSQSNLSTVLSQMPPPHHARDLPNDKPLPNTADQSAFLFFTAVLLFVDIISSTTLDQPPRLQSYHHSLLSSSQKHSISLALERFIGCPNRVLLAISDISSLSAWKKSARCTDNLSLTNLINQSASISQALEEDLAELDLKTASSNLIENKPNNLADYYSRPASEITASLDTVARIWANAAEIYLSIVTSGWQPASPEIQNRVMKILSLFRSIKSPAQLRSLAWPLCVTGSLALPCQEQEFRAIGESMGERAVFGTIGQVGRIMEQVWGMRDRFDESWDIAACLRILGSPALLV